MEKKKDNEELGVVKYDVTEAALEEMKGYLTLKVTDIDDETGFKHVHEKRMVVKGVRVSVQKREQEYKDQLNGLKRDVRDKAKIIYDAIEPIETHLQVEEDKVTKEKERIKAEKIRIETERVERIRAKIESLNTFSIVDPGTASVDIQKTINMISKIDIEEGFFAEFINEAFQVRGNTLTTLALARDKMRTWEAEQAAAKAEAERLEKIRLEQEDKMKELDAREAEIARQDREKKKIIETQVQKEREERIAQEAIEQAEKDRIAKEKAEAKEKARQEALKPDKDKIIQFSSMLLKLEGPVLKSPEARQLLEKALDEIIAVAHRLAKKAKTL